MVFMASELDQYDYDLPRELIAQQPLARRSDARLLVVDRQSEVIEHYHVRDLPEILKQGDRLVLNNTRVIPASLAGYRTNTGGRWQGLFLSLNEEGHWRILCKTRGRLSAGETVMLIDRTLRDVAQLRLIEKLPGGAWLAHPEPHQEALELLEQVGRVPLPHYIHGGEMRDSDRQTYQTVFAQEPGAVAAPTAGLHFTEALLKQLEQQGIGRTRVTLHVGLGTFRPITADTLSEHVMHSEWAAITPEAVSELQQTRATGGRIVAVGTTTVRTLESASQSGQLEPWTGETNLFIRPPYQFRSVDMLLTNFHLPRSTLLVLVYTFGGRELIRRAYEEAIANEYRFYSYGDAMLIL